MDEGNSQQRNRRKPAKRASVDQLHHRAAYSMAIIIANMLYAEHKARCLQLLQVDNPTQVYERIRHFLAVCENEKNKKKRGRRTKENPHKQ